MHALLSPHVMPTKSPGTMIVRLNRLDLPQFLGCVAHGTANTTYKLYFPCQTVVAYRLETQIVSLVSDGMLA